MLPLAAGREAGAAEAAQARVFHRRDDVVDVALAARCTRAAARSRPPRDRRRSRCSRRDDVGASRARAGARPAACTRLSAVACGTGFWPTTATGAVLAAADARRARARARPRRAAPAASRAASCAPAISHDIESHTRTVIARRRGLAFLHHVEVVIEGRDLVDLGHRQLHLVGERDQMRGRRRPKRSWILCRCSISRSRRRGASPSSARTSASACGIDAPAARRLALALAVEPSGRRSGDELRASGAIGAPFMSTAAPHRAPTWYLAPSTSTGISVEYG